jgi:hypothetical protein
VSTNHPRGHTDCNKFGQIELKDEAAVHGYDSMVRRMEAWTMAGRGTRIVELRGEGKCVRYGVGILNLGTKS